MPSKIDLLRDFYNTIDTTKVKIETRFHGLPYCRELNHVATLDYLTFENEICKYRISGLSSEVFNEFVEQHIEKKINLCAYFDSEQSSLFAFNLDLVDGNANNLRIFALYLLKAILFWRIIPMIIKSGHGYHFWCKISEPIPNIKLQAFMKYVRGKAIKDAVDLGVNIDALRCTCYPRKNTGDISIRLFGSKHTTTGCFSNIVTEIGTTDTILDECNSWLFFDNYLRKCCIPAPDFFNVCKEIGI